MRSGGGYGAASYGAALYGGATFGAEPAGRAFWQSLATLSLFAQAIAAITIARDERAIDVQAMPLFNNEIKDFVIGDDLDVIRTILNVPAGQTIVRAWLTVKEALSTPDSAAVFQKVITAAPVAGQGQIAATGASGTAIILFALTGDDTARLQAGFTYQYDIQLKSSASKRWTPEKGTIKGEAQVTLAIE